jgi:hypothetical protein
MAFTFSAAIGFSPRPGTPRFTSITLDSITNYTNPSNKNAHQQGGRKE